MSRSKPNVIFVLTDDQGYGDLGCHGNPFLKTPNLDSLYAESVRFTDFHVAPVCTPTRGELMTGRDALCNGATFVCMGRSLLRADLPTAADIFSANGYHTGHFGKWHLGDNYPYRPQDRGFDETVYHPAWGITSAPDYFENDYFDDHYRHKDQIEQYKGYCTDVWFEEATHWIEGCRKRSEPFFAYIATNAPHGPLWVPDQYRSPYLSDVSRDEASFFGMIANIDENVGRLDSYLEKSGLRDDTVFIFMTDNGTASGERVFNAGMRGRKASLYDGGHRVPFFLRWTRANIGGTGGGRDIRALSRGTDLLPTLVELCNLEVDDGLSFDGLSLVPSLESGRITESERTTVVQYGHANEGTWGYSDRFNASVLMDRYRLLYGKELYDIGADPGQNEDISDHEPEIVATMRGAYEEWWGGVSENLTAYQPLVIGSARENPMRLCSADWAWVYADNQQGIRGCVMDSGTWHARVAKRGNYRFSLRRWPEESGFGISSPAPLYRGVDGDIPPGKGLPVESASLTVGKDNRTMRVPDDATEVSFEIPLEPGETQIASWWYDADAKPLAGAYYLTVERRE